MAEPRTDLCLEAAAGLNARGVHGADHVREGVPLHIVEITTPRGARAVGKPMGRYVTLDLGPIRRRERTAFARSARVLAGETARLLPPGEGPVLVVCLGNRRVTPDALGPLTWDSLLITRHLVDAEPDTFGAFRPVAAVAPGVLASTGVESAALARALVREVSPAAVIAVDALAARSVDRLCATVQLSDAGVAPGSGVGNHRDALDRDSLGVPVIALGVPTVAGMEGGTFVTPRDIDVRVAETAKLLAYGLSMALQPGLSLDDLLLLLE